MKWLLLSLALLQGAWLTFDGLRAFTLGDYFTPRSGSRAGQLGPWSKIVSAAGFEPRSNFIKSIHVSLGILWLIGIGLFLLRPDLGWWLLLCCAIGTLWYLPLGTILSIITLILLFTPHLRRLS